MPSSRPVFLIVLFSGICAKGQLSGNSGRGGVGVSSFSTDADANDDYFRGASNVVVVAVAAVMCGLLLLFSVGVVLILTCCKNKTGPIVERARGSMMWARGSLFPTLPSPNGRSGSFLSPFRATRSRSSSSCGDKRYKVSDADCEAANQLNNDQ